MIGIASVLLTLGLVLWVASAWWRFAPEKKTKEVKPVVPIKKPQDRVKVPRLLRFAEDSTRRVLAGLSEGEELAPVMFVLTKRDPETGEVGTRTACAIVEGFADAEWLASEGLPSMIEEMEADAVVLVAESWALEIGKDQPIPEGSLADKEGRTEIVALTYCDPERVVGAFATIEMTKEGRKLKSWEHAEGVDLGGRLADAMRMGFERRRDVGGNA
jgi:hypothetical protein